MDYQGSEQAFSSRANTDIAGADNRRPRHSPNQEDGNHNFHLQLAETTLNPSQESQMDETIPSEFFTAAPQMQFPILQPSANRPLPQISPLTGFPGSSGSSRSTDTSSVSPNAAMGLQSSFENAGPGHRSDYQRLTSAESVSQSEKEEFQDIFSELMTGTEHETAFLTRHYAEVISPWSVGPSHAFNHHQLTGNQARRIRHGEVFLGLCPDQGHQQPSA